MGAPDFKVNQQVTIRHKLAGKNMSKISTGTILAFKDGGRVATVSIAADNVRRDLPVEKLEPINKRFVGRVGVPVNSRLRHM